MDQDIERITTALGAMSSGPRNLLAYLAQPGPDFEKADSADVSRMINLLLSDDPNDYARLRFSNLMRSWDNAKDAAWVSDTRRNSAERRQLIHQLLKSGPTLVQRIDALIPFYHLEEPLIISEEHEPWYAPQPGVRDYYWSTYLQYLRDHRGWDEASVLTMDNNTRVIVESLANPTARSAYQSRGLVMGYVQSGKTANFMGVVARAADAGYRLIIVLAGTWNILRNQTQRRFDKELLGKELLQNDESYTAQPPPDWPEFLHHGGDPATSGNYIWQRLTRPDIDFKRLKSAIDNLEFERADKSAPIYAANNLYSLPAKLLVIKKHSGILHNLVRDLKILRVNLRDLPTLIIDDESDQAGVNTAFPSTNSANEVERNKTNQRLVELLNLFPRGQYVGYTATPYANAFINPDDPEDLFPKDFIVPLPRPSGYMGVTDFFDPDVAFEDLDQKDFSLPEIAYIRRVESPIGSDDDALKNALRSYVLAGGIKLYRLKRDPQRYKAASFKHHTMLVHTSQLRGEHASLADRLHALWTECAFNTPRGLADLKSLWEDDYSRVCTALGSEMSPAAMSELVPFLADAIKRIELGPKVFLVVNSERSEAPDFSAAPVWKVIVGGNKLSRGYTIEGLTISYYRRVAGAVDTLIQMGRWFGFRPGYQDLVRVFLGVREGRRGDADLVSLFKEACSMEEGFREDIKRYVSRPGAKRITPKEVPPLISASGNLPPTSRKKMFNAILASKNFGGQRSMLTLAPVTPSALDANMKALGRLLAAAEQPEFLVLGGVSSDGKSIEAPSAVLSPPNDHIVEFLKSYRWLESDYGPDKRPTDANLQIEFLKNPKNEIDRWLVVAPQRQSSFGPEVVIEGVGVFTVKERHRVAGRGFQVFGEPAHRLIGEFLAGIKSNKAALSHPNPATASIRKRNSGVLLLYPVREAKGDAVSIGFELLFPPNKLPFDVNFTVRRKAEQSQVVVDSTK